MILQVEILHKSLLFPRIYHLKFYLIMDKYTPCNGLVQGCAGVCWDKVDSILMSSASSSSLSSLSDSGFSVFLFVCGRSTDCVIKVESFDQGSIAIRKNRRLLCLLVCLRTKYRLCFQSRVFWSGSHNNNEKPLRECTRPLNG